MARNCHVYTGGGDTIDTHHKPNLQADTQLDIKPGQSNLLLSFFKVEDRKKAQAYADYRHNDSQEIFADGQCRFAASAEFISRKIK